MEEPIKIFKAVSDNNRLRILNMLKVKPLCVCEITEILELAASTVSQHLSLLKNAGFIYEQKEGKWVNYIINRNAEDERVRAIVNKLSFWTGDSGLLQSDLKKAETIDRFEVCGR